MDNDELFSLLTKLGRDIYVNKALQKTAEEAKDAVDYLEEQGYFTDDVQDN